MEDSCEPPPKKPKSIISQENDILFAATSVLEKIAGEKTSPTEEQDASFCNFIRTELSQITNADIKDEVKEAITSIIFNGKKKQKQKTSTTYL